jgi:hypothetical protein
MGFDLPAELQIHIFSFLERYDVKNVRRVCRKFRDNASPHVFNTALVCTRYRALSVLKLMSLHESYRTYIKELVFDGSVYSRVLASSWDLYRNNVRHYNATLEWCGHGHVSTLPDSLTW